MPFMIKRAVSITIPSISVVHRGFIHRPGLHCVGCCINKLPGVGSSLP